MSAVFVSNRFKEMSANDKSELLQLQKQFKEISNQLTVTSEENYKLDENLQVRSFALFCIAKALKLQFFTLSVHENKGRKLHV